MKRYRWVAGLLAASGAFYLLHEWGTRWGASPIEFRQPYPGDEVVPNPDLELTNAISVRAPAQAIWPWLVQMGYYRGGWHTDSSWRDWDYFPDRILRFFVREEEAKSGIHHREAPTDAEIRPEHQNLKAGDLVMDGPPGTAFFIVIAIEPEKYLVYHSNSHLRFVFPKSIREDPRFGIAGEFTWGFYLQEAVDGNARLIMRTRGVIEPWWYRIFINSTVPVANLFLARKMLGGLKRMVERSLEKLSRNS